nr:DUF1841 family protein [Euzebyales bacterium]
MSDKRRRDWAVPPGRGHVDGIDLGLLDRADSDGRALLVKAEHSELGRALAQGRGEVVVDGEPMRPGLHLAMHEVVANQLWDDDPPEVWRTAQRLTVAGYERHDVLHMVISAAAEQLRQALQTGRPFDLDRYRADLDALPGSWEGLSADRRDPGGGMRFGPDDEASYHAARDDLLDRFDAWRADRELGDDGGEDRSTADLLLGFKWGYLDGDLARWTSADLHEILAELFPRKVMLDDDGAGLVVPSTRRFLEFLADIGVMASDSDPVAQLRRTLSRLEPRFPELMSDPSRFGMAKGIGAQLADAGIDLTDPAAVEGWMAQFNALPEAERRARLPLPGDVPRVLPPADLPDEGLLAAHSSDAPAMVQLRMFLEWLGDGKALTQKGNLKLADGKALVELLATGDVVDEVVGDQTFRTRSSTDLVGVERVFRLALASRLVRRHRGRVLATRTRTQRLARDPLGAWADVVEALLDLGVLRAGADVRGWWWDEVLEEGVPALLELLYGLAERIPAADLAEGATASLDAQFDLDQLPEWLAEALPRYLADDVDRILERLAWVGVVQRSGTTAEELYGRRRERGGDAALTPAGRWLVRRRLLGQGFTEAAEVDLDAAPAAVVRSLAA